MGWVRLRLPPPHNSNCPFQIPGAPKSRGGAALERRCVCSAFVPPDVWYNPSFSPSIDFLNLEPGSRVLSMAPWDDIDMFHSDGPTDLAWLLWFWGLFRIIKLILDCRIQSFCSHAKDWTVLPRTWGLVGFLWAGS